MERETRLARVVDQLRRRLEQQQAENEQLEDLLRQADTSLNGKVPLLSILDAARTRCWKSVDTTTSSWQP